MQAEKMAPAESSAFETTINPKNWDYLSFDDPVITDRISNVLATYAEHGNQISRQIIKDIYRRDLGEGVVATIFWGYTKGRYPGGKGFQDVIAHLDDIVAVLRDAKARKGSISTYEVCRRMGQVAGMGVSTYTKMLYLAEIETSDGICLIYDQMIMRAISVSDEPELASIRKKLGDCIVERNGKRSYRTYTQNVQEDTYGAFIRAARRIAQRDGQHPADVEQRIFFEAPNGRLD